MSASLPALRGTRVRFPFPPLALGRVTGEATPVELSADELVRHLAVFGATGTGKTSFFLALMLELMDRSAGFIFCTTKHDPVFPRALAWAAYTRGQIWRLRLFDPLHPVHAYDPISTQNPLTLARLYHSQLPRVDPSSEAQHYHELAMEFLLVACRAILATGLRHVPDDLLQLATNWDLARPHLREQLARVGAQDLLANLDAFFRRFYRRQGERDDFQIDRAREVLSGLTAALTQLELGSFERFLGEARAAIDLLSACRRGLWTYLGLTRTTMAGEGQLGRLFLTDLISTLDEIQATEGTLAHAPFVILLDEFPSYALPEFATVFEQARSTGVALIMGAQTVSGLSDRALGLSEAFRDRILGNCAHLMAFRIGPGEGADYLSRYVGRTDREFPQASRTESHGRTWSPVDPWSWFGMTHRTDQHMSFAGYREAKDTIMEPRVLTHELAPKGEAIWLSQREAQVRPVRFWPMWADAQDAPHGWDYQALAPQFKAEPPASLNLGRLVRQTLYRKTVAASAPAGADSQAKAPDQPRAKPGPRQGGQGKKPIPTSFFFAPPGSPGPGKPKPKTKKTTSDPEDAHTEELAQSTLTDDPEINDPAGPLGP